LVNREGMEIQIEETIARKPGSTLKVDDVIDNSLITELDREDFIDKLYRSQSLKRFVLFERLERAPVIATAGRRTLTV
jgi:hypothetical protein